MTFDTARAPPAPAPPRAGRCGAGLGVTAAGVGVGGGAISGRCGALGAHGPRPPGVPLPPPSAGPPRDLTLRDRSRLGTAGPRHGRGCPRRLRAGLPPHAAPASAPAHADGALGALGAGRQVIVRQPVEAKSYLSYGLMAGRQAHARPRPRAASVCVRPWGSVRGAGGAGRPPPPYSSPYHSPYCTGRGTTRWLRCSSARPSASRPSSLPPPWARGRPRAPDRLRGEGRQPRWPEALHNLGICLANQERHQEAVAYFLRVFLLQPGYPGARENLQRLREQGVLHWVV